MSRGVVDRGDINNVRGGPTARRTEAAVMVADGLDCGRRPPVPMLALLMYHQVGRRPYQTRPARSVGRPAGVLLNAPRHPDRPPGQRPPDHPRPWTACGPAAGGDGEGGKGRGGAEEKGKTSFR